MSDANERYLPMKLADASPIQLHVRVCSRPRDRRNFWLRSSRRRWMRCKKEVEGAWRM